MRRQIANQPSEHVAAAYSGELEGGAEAVRETEEEVEVRRLRVIELES